MCKLDLSKILVQEFHYYYIKTNMVTTQDYSLRLTD